MLEYIQIYADSVSGNDETDKRSSNAKKLQEYLSNNKEGLLPYQERGIKMAKALYRKENRELIDTIERYTDGLILTMQMQISSGIICRC